MKLLSKSINKLTKYNKALILMILLISSISSYSQYQISVSFNDGFIGVDSNGNTSISSWYLSTLGWSSLKFSQNSTGTQFIAGAQGNDVPGNALITDYSGTTYSIPGALNWRSPSGNNPTIVVFRPAIGVNLNLVTNVSPFTYNIIPTNDIGLNFNGSTLSIAGASTGTGTVGGNAAGVLNAINTYLGTIPSVISSTTPLTTFSACSGSVSAEQSFTVSGTGLGTNLLVVTAPTGYQVSTASGGSFTSSVSFTPVTGSVSIKTIFVRLASTATNGASGNIVVSSTGAVSSNIATGSAVITATPNAGTISGQGTVCSGTNSTSLTLNGSVGTVTKWQSSTVSDFSSAVSDIANTTTSLIVTNLSAATYYRALVTNGSCGSATSPSVTMTVSPTSVAGSISGATSVCSGTNSTSLTLNGSIGAVTKWQSSIVSDFSSAVTDISNTTNSLTATNLTATTYYRAEVKSGVCSSVNNNVATITVNPLPTIILGYVDDVPVAATTFSIPYTATTGSPDKYSLITAVNSVTSVAMAGFTPVSNASLGSSPIVVTIPTSTAAEYGFNLTIRNSTTECYSVYPFQFHVTSIDHGAIGYDQTICSGSTAAALTNVTSGSATNGGTITYTWEKSTTSIGSGYSTISGETSENYSPGILTQTTYFKRVAHSIVGATDVTADSDPITIAVTTNPNAGTDGTLTVCAGTTPSSSELFAALIGSPDAGGTWSNVGLVHTYTVTATLPCTGNATATVTVTEQAQPSAGTDGTLTVCAGTIPSSSELFAALIGSPDTGGTWTNTGLVYTYTVTATLPCTGNATATVTVTEQAQPSAGTDGTLTVCAGTTPSSSELFAALIGSPNAGGTWSNLGLVHTYTVTATLPCTGNATATVTVTEQAQPSAGTDGTLTVCAGTTPSSSELFAALIGSPDTGGTWSNVGLVYTYTVPATLPCSGNATATVTVTVINTNIWNGSVSTDWNTADNWNCGVPASGVNIEIPGGLTNYPELDSSRTIGNIILSSGATLNLNNFNLNVSGTFSGTGTLIGSNTSNLNVNGSGAQGTFYMDQTTPGTTNILNNFILNSTTSGSVTLGNAMDVFGTLTLTNGTFNTGGNLTLKSNSAGTAVVAPITDCLNVAITGDVTVERFFPARRAFRFISSPVTTSTTIRANWQEGQNNLPPAYTTNSNLYPGYGTHITGNIVGTNGFDATQTTNNSMFTYNNSIGGWAAVPNTNALTLTAGVPYRLLIRGDRSIIMNTNNPDPTDTTLRSKGALKICEAAAVTLSQNANGYSFIGNPYQATVDIKEVLDNATNLNTNYYWVWDPKINTRGGYVAYDLNSRINMVGPTSKVNEFLQPWQACFVKTSSAGAASITFQESNKATSVVNEDVYRSNSNLASYIRLTLFESNTLAANGVAADGVIVKFGNNFSNDVDANDATKFSNQDEMLSTKNNTTLLGIESRLFPLTTDVVPLNITQYRFTNYTMVASGNNMSGLTAYLHDQLLQTYTEIPQSGSVNYSYVINASDATTSASDRFRIVFQNPTLNLENTAALSFTMYPNPSKNGVFDVGMNGATEDTKLTIYNAIGQEVYATNLTQTTINHIKPNKVFAKGVYYVKIKKETATTVKKLIIE